eukprot:TRINITY_DN818_c0_g1_i1.p1 TRINITY_DN818_c0_g1~~TRINITY_DN818_c0_g1_i1.p1  ORF type:complete len:174 (+),score=12.97 TRINITY_DN818_c0_g1_i1:132-653(+)
MGDGSNDQWLFDWGSIKVNEANWANIQDVKNGDADVPLTRAFEIDPLLVKACNPTYAPTSRPTLPTPKPTYPDSISPTLHPVAINVPEYYSCLEKTRVESSLRKYLYGSVVKSSYEECRAMCTRENSESWAGCMAYEATVDAGDRSKIRCQMVRNLSREAGGSQVDKCRGRVQ